MKINYLSKSPIKLIGLFTLLSLFGCQSQQSPEQITLSFWSAMAENNLQRARNYCSQQSASTLTNSSAKKLEHTRFSYGKIIIDDNQASVETKMMAKKDNEAPFTFTTYLLRNVHEIT